jgi:3-dehydroquinate synthetase
MCSESVKERLVRVLKKLNLPVSVPCNIDVITEAVRHDKKASGDNITFIWVEEAGSFEMRNCTMKEFDSLIKEKLI